MRHRLLRLLIAALVGNAVLACGGETAVTTTTEAVTVGAGVLPASVPAGFPLPSRSTIGATTIDRPAHRTEFEVISGWGLETTVRAFELGLVNQGYVVTGSSGSIERWVTEFTSGELRGTIVTTAQPGTPGSTALVSLNTI
jgi:hypothetical protein